MSTFDDWSVLGIEPTKDVSVIREAYLNALPGFHPEDDPAGFMKLRSAYEGALAAAREDEETEEDNADESGRLLTRGRFRCHDDIMTSEPSPCQQPSASVREANQDAPFDEILSDFPRRMKTEEWEKLFDECGYGLDQQEALSEKLLIALLEGQYLPRRIWLLFDRTFSWSARVRQLKENFAPGYIEYVLNGIRYERAIRDEFFDFERDSGEDFDAFVKDYHLLAENLRQGDMEAAEKQISGEAGKLYEHPDYQILVSRYHRLKEEYEKEKEILDELDQRWPNDPNITTAIGETYLRDEPEKALEIFNEVLKTDPELYTAKIGAARARFSAGMLEEAKADSYEMLMLDPYDGNAMNVFGVANEALVPVFTERLKKDPADMEARYKLSSCLFNLGRYEESLDLIIDAEPDEKNRAKHYELYADLFAITTPDMTDEDRGILLEYLRAWEEAETDRQRMKFLPEKYHRLGINDVALEKAEILITEFPGDPELCRVRAQIFRERGDEHNAFSAVSEGLEKSPAHPALIAVEALLLEESGNLGAAVNNANVALEGFPFMIEMWELLGRVYERVDQYADVLDTVRRAEEFGLSSEALSLLKAVALFETEDPNDEAVGLFEDILDKDPYNPLCLEKLSILYARKGRTGEAMELADLLIEKHGIPFAYLLRGWLLANYPQASDRFAKARARADFRKALELNDRYAPAWYQLGVLAYDEGRMAEAAADFQLTLDIDPGFTDVHFYLAIAYNRTGDSLNAIRVLDEGISMAGGTEDDKAIANLILKKADILDEHHMYRELAELGEKPAELEESPAGALGRTIDLAAALYETYEDEKAETFFKRAFEEIEKLSPEEKTHYGTLLYTSYAHYIRYAKKDVKASLEYYEKSLEGSITMRSVVRLAKAYRAAGDNKEAAKLFKKALKLKKKEDDACSDYLIGECLYGLGQTKKAKEYLGRAVKRAADCGNCPKRYCFEAEFTLGLIALDENDIVTARAHYEKVLETVQDRDYLEAASLFGL